jgi:elongation factor P
MKVQANSMRPGHVIEHNGKLWIVTKAQIRTPGNLRAFIQIEMKDVKTGTKSEGRFATTDTVERAQLTNVSMQYLYNDGNGLVFMNQETYDQVTINPDVLGDSVAFLQDGMVCDVQFHESTALSVELPETVILEIAEADPVVKGQTASSSYKPAILSNGVKVMVPPFIGAGDKIVVRTADAEYMERAK